MDSHEDEDFTLRTHGKCFWIDKTVIEIHVRLRFFTYHRLCLVSELVGRGDPWTLLIDKYRLINNNSYY